MKKTIIGIFILITTLTYGEDSIKNTTVNPVNKGTLTENTGDNEIIIENLKETNENLKAQLEKLQERLNDWKLGLISYKDIKDQGISIMRDRNTLTLTIKEENLDDEKYSDILDDLAKVMKYDVNSEFYIKGSEYNMNYLENFFSEKDILNVIYETVVLDKDSTTKDTDTVTEGESVESTPSSDLLKTPIETNIIFKKLESKK